MLKVKTYENGLTLVVKKMDGLLSVSAGILVKAGAANETDAEDGLSHFIEHMQFKGTDTKTAFLTARRDCLIKFSTRRLLTETRDG